MSQKTYGMNSDEVKREGGILQDNASAFLTEINNLENYNSSLKQIWKGTGSESYFTKWEEKKESIKKLQSWLSGFADATVKVGLMAERTDSDVSGRMR